MDVSVLLSEDSELVPDLAQFAKSESAPDRASPAIREVAPSTEERAENGDLAAGAAAESRNLEGDLARLALLSTPPHTGAAGATSLNETLRSALHNIGANRTRGLLTMLGIIIGVLSVVVLQSIGNGFQGYVDDLTGQYGGNNVIIQPARLIVNGIDSGTLQKSLAGRCGGAPATRRRSGCNGGLADGERAGVASCGLRPQLCLDCRGRLAHYLTVGGYKLTAGTFVTSEDVTNRALVIDLGANPAKMLFGSDNPGETVWVNDNALRVIGVMAATNPEIGGGDDSVYIPLSTALDHVIGGTQHHRRSKAVDSITIRANSSATIAAVQDEGTALLNQRHGTEGSPDFVTSSLLSALQQRAEILAAMDAFMVVVAGISLIVGGIGIMNIMLVSVTERTREIGMRKAVGATDNDILNQFLVESMLISPCRSGHRRWAGGADRRADKRLLATVPPPSVVGIRGRSVRRRGHRTLLRSLAPRSAQRQLQPIQALRGE